MQTTSKSGGGKVTQKTEKYRKSNRAHVLASVLRMTADELSRDKLEADGAEQARILCDLLTEVLAHARDGSSAVAVRQVLKDAGFHISPRPTKKAAGKKPLHVDIDVAAAQRLLRDYCQRNPQHVLVKTDVLLKCLDMPTALFYRWRKNNDAGFPKPCGFSTDNGPMRWNVDHVWAWLYDMERKNAQARAVQSANPHVG